MTAEAGVVANMLKSVDNQTNSILGEKKEMEESDLHALIHV